MIKSSSLKPKPLEVKRVEVPDNTNQGNLKRSPPLGDQAVTLPATRLRSKSERSSKVMRPRTSGEKSGGSAAPADPRPLKQTGRVKQLRKAKNAAPGGAQLNTQAHGRPVQIFGAPPPLAFAADMSALSAAPSKAQETQQRLVRANPSETTVSRSRARSMLDPSMRKSLSNIKGDFAVVRSPHSQSPLRRLRGQAPEGVTLPFKGEDFSIDDVPDLIGMLFSGGKYQATKNAFCDAHPDIRQAIDLAFAIATTFPAPNKASQSQLAAWVAENIDSRREAGLTDAQRGDIKECVATGDAFRLHALLAGYAGGTVLETLYTAIHGRYLQFLKTQET